MQGAAIFVAIGNCTCQQDALFLAPGERPLLKHDCVYQADLRGKQFRPARLRLKNSRYESVVFAEKILWRRSGQVVGLWSALPIPALRELQDRLKRSEKAAA